MTLCPMQYTPPKNNVEVENEVYVFNVDKNRTNFSLCLNNMLGKTFKEKRRIFLTSCNLETH